MGEVALEADATGGLLSVDASLDDALAALSVHGEGDWREDNPVYRATVDAQHLNLKSLGLWDREEDSVALIAFKATGRYTESGVGSGESVMNKNWSSLVSMRNVHFVTSSKNVRINGLALSSRMQNHWMSTTLHSDLADASLHGYYEFALLPELISQIVSDYLPKEKDNEKEKTTEGGSWIEWGRFEFRRDGRRFCAQPLDCQRHYDPG